MELTNHSSKSKMSFAELLSSEVKASLTGITLKEDTTLLPPIGKFSSNEKTDIPKVNVNLDSLRFIHVFKMIDNEHVKPVLQS